MRPILVALGLVFPLLGCLAPPSAAPAPPTPAQLAELFAAAIEPLHDHTDAALHMGGYGLTQAAWSSLGVTLGDNGFANFVFHEEGDERLAFVAVDGDAEGGFVVADVRDPTRIEVIGRYTAPGSGFQEVRVLPGGKYVLQNVQQDPTAGSLAQGAGGCSLCIHVVDVSDRAAPRLASVYPVELRGTHNMDVVEQDDEILVYFVGQQRYAPVGGLPVGNTAPGNSVGIARFVDDAAGPRLVRVGDWRHPDALLDPRRSYPHDIVVREHPVTGQDVMHVSHWEGGAITVDVSDPTAPRTLAVNKDPAPSDVSAMHWFAPEPAMRGDRLLAWSAPEIQELPTGTGVIRAYDLTDPSVIEQIGTWTLPGELAIPGQFLFSPHLTDLDAERNLLAVSHYHAGVWILDVATPETPRAVAYAMPHGDPASPYDGPIWWKKPNFDPEGFVPNVYQARWGKDGRLWLTERGTGMYVYELAGAR